MQKVDPRRLVNQIVLLALVQDQNDYLETTSAYRREIKQHAKPLGKFLEKYLESNLNALFNADEQTYINLSRNIEQFGSTITDLTINATPEDFAELNQLVKMYFSDKEKFKEKFEIDFRQLNA